MAEPLTTQLVGEELKKLLAVFPRSGKTDTTVMAEVYKGGLRGLDGTAVRGAVEICIQSDTYFPKVARLREAAHDWAKRNRPRFETRVAPAWNVCPICGATAQTIGIARPKLVKPDPSDQRTWYQLVEHGRPVMEIVQSMALYVQHRPEAHHVFAEDFSEPHDTEPHQETA